MLEFFYGRLAWQSIRRNPGLAVVMVVGLAPGINTWVTAHAAIHGALRDPLPDRSDLYQVSLVRPASFAGVAPLLPGEDRRLDTGPRFTISEPEARAMAAASRAPTRWTATFCGRAAVRQPGGQLAADLVRFAARDLFAMFELDFAHGGPWSAADDAAGAEVVVIDEATARALFQTPDAVGRTIEIAGRPLRVTGVLAGGRREKLYDHIYFSHVTERFFVPFETHRRLDIDPEYSYNVHAAPGPPDAPRLNETALFAWAELPSPERRAAFVADVGAAGLPVRILPFAQFRSEYYTLHPGYYLLDLFATIVLVASALNLVRLLLAKFSARVDLSGIHRALGATRRSIVMVHIVEAKIIGIAAGVLGLGLGFITVPIMNLLIPDRLADAIIDPTTVLVTVTVAVSVGIISGVYPAWRATRQAPAVFLRRQ